MWFESLLVFILFKLKKRPNASGIRVVLTFRLSCYTKKGFTKFYFSRLTLHLVVGTFTLCCSLIPLFCELLFDLSMSLTHGPPYQPISYRNRCGAENEITWIHQWQSHGITHQITRNPQNTDIFFVGAMSDHVFIHNLKSGPYCQIYVTCSQMSKTTADLHAFLYVLYLLNFNTMHRDYYSPLHLQVQRSS